MEQRVKADIFFTEQERKKIKDTVRDVESRTIGEIAVMIVESSDHYREAEIIGGILLGTFLSLMVIVSYFHGSLWLYIPLSFILFFPSLFVFRKVPLLKTVFIGRLRREDAVRSRALRAFYERGLHKTRKNTGVLFFLSLLERKVWVLADSGIHGKIGQETLRTFAQDVSRGMRDGLACESLIEAIQGIGALLEKNFPLTPGDEDELPDEVMSG